MKKGLILVVLKIDVSRARKKVPGLSTLPYKFIIFIPVRKVILILIKGSICSPASQQGRYEGFRG